VEADGNPARSHDRQDSRSRRYLRL
jgi:hypothetical protein